MTKCGRPNSSEGKSPRIRLWIYYGRLKEGTGADPLGGCNLGLGGAFLGLGGCSPPPSGSAPGMKPCKAEKLLTEVSISFLSVLIMSVVNSKPGCCGTWLLWNCSTSAGIVRREAQRGHDSISVLHFDASSLMKNLVSAIQWSCSAVGWSRFWCRLYNRP